MKYTIMFWILFIAIAAPIDFIIVNTLNYVKVETPNDVLGHAIGICVFTAISAGIANWITDKIEMVINKLSDKQ